MKRTFLAAAAVAVALVPAVPRAAGVVANPFGNLDMTIVQQPSGQTPGKARLKIVTANGQAFTPGEDRIYFGLRLMGGEDIQMGDFSLTGDGDCIVSDFAGSNTPGWQGAPLFGAPTPAGSGNAHMRMIGGFLEKACGNILIDITFTARPLVVFYGAFFGYEAAPWHQNYDEAPWNVVPTGGDASTQRWWNLWGSFDTLGYSNACTNTTGTAVGC